MKPNGKKRWAGPNATTWVRGAFHAPICRSFRQNALAPHTLPSDGSTASRPITALTDSLRALAVFRRCALNLFRPRARFLNFFFSSHAHELVVPDQMQLLNVGSCIRDRCAIFRFLFFLLTRERIHRSGSRSFPTLFLLLFYYFTRSGWLKGWISKYLRIA